MIKNTYILAIETSCDETAASVSLNGREILSNVVASQIDVHKEFGGVVPEIASRKHVEMIIPVIDKAIKDAGIKESQINAIGVTYGPGLIGALLVGVSAAKSLAYYLDIPLIGVNHIKGHISANYITHNKLEPPFVCLVVSGGHSHIIKINNFIDYEILGRTRDDAAGEAFDKIARALNLGYPGGPIIDKIALDGDENAVNFPKVKFKDQPYDFSFSGVKTSVLNYINKIKLKDEDLNIPNICAGFQKAVTDVLAENTIQAALKIHMDKVCLAGGVAANKQLRNTLKNLGVENNIDIYLPEIKLCTDNAAMISCAAYYEFIESNFADLKLNAISNLKI